MLEQAMETAGAPWDLLDLEITETALVEGDFFLIEKFKPLRARGVKIAIDYLGIGYSHLARLRSLPIDTLKHDRPLIDDNPHIGGESGEGGGRDRECQDE